MKMTRAPRACARCGEPTKDMRGHLGRTPSYCSVACRRAVEKDRAPYRSTCLTCGQRFTGTVYRQGFCDRCEDARAATAAKPANAVAWRAAFERDRTEREHAKETK